MLRPIFLMSLAHATSTAAFAQHPFVLQRLGELNAKAPAPPVDDLTAAVYSTATRFAAVKKSCSPVEVKLTEVAPVTGAGGVLPAVLSGKIRNAWTAYAQYIGCDDVPPTRFMIVQQPDGALHAMRVHAGRSYANPSIIKDTALQAAVAALTKGKSIDPSCTGKDMDMGRFRVTGQSNDLGPEVFGVRYVGSWNEVWQFSTCGRTYDVPVSFTPDGDGGARTQISVAQVTVAPAPRPSTENR